MVLSVTVPDSISDSTALQKLIDKTGNTPAKFTFTQDHNIEIISPLEFYNYFELDGHNCYFELMKNAPTSVFNATIGLMSPKSKTAAEGIHLHDFRFNGMRDYQAGVKAIYGEKPWGHGYHNLVMLGYFGCVNYNNAKNCEIDHVTAQDSLGDGVRAEGVTNLKVHDITASRLGHDACYMTANGGEIYNMNVDLCVNSGARLKSSHNVKIHDNVFTGTKDAYSPGIEIGSDAKNWTMANIEVYNNTIKNTLGPGIQVASSVTGDGNVSVHHNLLDGCGRLPAPYSGVGGIIFDGIPIDIEYNTVVNSLGYGIAAAKYDSGSTYAFKATVAHNIVTGTKRSAIVGTASGSGIANILGSRATINCFDNDSYGNLTNYYNVTTGMSKDPLFTSDYHLQSRSPCSQWGRYAGTTTVTPVAPAVPTDLILECDSSYIDSIINSLSTTNYTAYRRE